jgi:iron complex transport system substrate-binding protein
MGAVWSRRTTALALVLLAAAARADEAPPRIVSLNPSITATLLALGAGSTLVGVDEYSARQQPEVEALPTVGGLFNTSLEAVVALAPDFVLLVPSAEQRDLRGRLEALGIEVVALPNIRLEDLLASIERLGRIAGCEAAARTRVAEIRRAWRRVEKARAGTPARRTVLVLQRDPLFVVGRGSFLDSMLEAAGAENPAAVFEEAYPRVSLEWLLATAPEVILDASEDPPEASRYWARWPSLPAVAAGRVAALPARQVTLPGPYLERGLQTLVRALDGMAAP